MSDSPGMGDQSPPKGNNPPLNSLAPAFNPGAQAFNPGAQVFNPGAQSPGPAPHSLDTPEQLVKSVEPSLDLVPHSLDTPEQLVKSAEPPVASAAQSDAQASSDLPVGPVQSAGPPVHIVDGKLPQKTSGMGLKCGVWAVCTVIANAQSPRHTCAFQRKLAERGIFNELEIFMKNENAYSEEMKTVYADFNLDKETYEKTHGASNKSWLSDSDIRVLVRYYSKAHSLKFNLVIFQFTSDLSAGKLHQVIEGEGSETLHIRNISDGHWEGYATTIDKDDISVDGAPLSIDAFVMKVDPRFNGGDLPSKEAHHHKPSSKCTTRYMRQVHAAGGDCMEERFTRGGNFASIMVGAPSAVQESATSLDYPANMSKLSSQRVVPMLPHPAKQNAADGDAEDASTEAPIGEKFVPDQFGGITLRTFRPLEVIPTFEGFERDCLEHGIDAALDKIKETDLIALKKSPPAKEKSQNSEHTGYNQDFFAPCFFKAYEGASLFPPRDPLTDVAPAEGRVQLFSCLSKSSIAPSLRLKAKLQCVIDEKMETHEILIDFPLREVYDHSTKSYKRGIRKGSLELAFNNSGAPEALDAIPQLSIKFTSDLAVFTNMLPKEQFLKHASQEERIVYDMWLNQIKGWASPKGPGPLHFVVIPFQTEIDTRRELFDKAAETAHTLTWSLENLAQKLRVHADSDISTPYQPWLRSRGQPQITFGNPVDRAVVIRKLAGQDFPAPLMAVPSTTRYIDAHQAETTLGTGAILDFIEESKRVRALDRQEHLATVIRLNDHCAVVGIDFQEGRPKMDVDQHHMAIPPNTLVKLSIRDPTKQSPIELNGITMEEDNPVGRSHDLNIGLSGPNVAKLRGVSKTVKQTEKLLLEKKYIRKYAVRLFLEPNIVTAKAVVASAHKVFAVDGPDSTNGAYLPLFLYDGNRNAAGAKSQPFSSTPKGPEAAIALTQGPSSFKWDKSQSKVIAESKELLHKVQLVCGPGGSGKTLIMSHKANAAVAAGGYALLASDRNTVVDNLAEKFHAAFPDIEICRVYGSADVTSAAAKKYAESKSAPPQDPDADAEKSSDSKSTSDGNDDNKPQAHGGTSPSEKTFAMGSEPVPDGGWDNSGTAPPPLASWGSPTIEPTLESPSAETLTIESAIGSAFESTFAEPPTNESWKPDAPSPTQAVQPQADWPSDVSDDQASDNGPPASDAGDDTPGGSIVRDVLLASVARRFAEKNHQRRGKVGELSVSSGILRYIEKGVVLNFRYHQGFNDKGEEIFDPDYPNEVNAFAELPRWFEKLNIGSFYATDDKGNDIWTEDDKTRFNQAWDVCRVHVLENAQVIATTVSNCASDDVRKIFASKNPKAPIFVEIDEAQTVSELLILILFGKCHSTLGHRIVSLCMYGDLNQIGLINVSEDGQNGGRCFNEFSAQIRLSFFERLAAAGFPISTLEYQARMPEYLWYPVNKEFYKGLIKTTKPLGGFPSPPDGWTEFVRRTFYPDMPKAQKPSVEQLYFHHLMLFGERLTTKSTITGSSANFASFNAVWILIEKLRPVFGDKMNESVIIMTPYRRQNTLHANKAQEYRAKGRSDASLPQTSTVDGAIGHEKLVVVLDYVVGSERGLGFLRDEKRSCVQFSRMTGAFIAVGSVIQAAEFDEEPDKTDVRWTSYKDLPDDAKGLLTDQNVGKPRRRKENARAPYSIMRFLQFISRKESTSAAEVKDNSNPLDAPHDILSFHDSRALGWFLDYLQEVRGLQDAVSKDVLEPELYLEFIEYREKYEEMLERRKDARTNDELDDFVEYVEGYETPADTLRIERVEKKIAKRAELQAKAEADAEALAAEEEAFAAIEPYEFSSPFLFPSDFFDGTREYSLIDSQDDIELASDVVVADETADATAENETIDESVSDGAAASHATVDGQDNGYGSDGFVAEEEENDGDEFDDAVHEMTETSFNLE
jgi:hypothetical protein